MGLRVWRGLAGAQDRGKLLLVRLRVARGGILINARNSTLAQRLNVPRARRPAVLLVPYYTLVLMGLGVKGTRTAGFGDNNHQLCFALNARHALYKSR